MRWHYYGTDPMTGRAESGEVLAQTADEAADLVADERNLVRIAVREAVPMEAAPEHWSDLMRHEYRMVCLRSAVPMTPAEFERWWS